MSLAVESALSSSLNGAGYLFSSSLLQKLLTFTLTQIVQSRVPASALGFAEVHMNLYLGTALFLSREGPRLTALRAPLGLRAGRGAPWQRLVNLAWLPVPIALAIVGACVLGRGALMAGTEGVAGAGAAMGVYCAVLLLEALAEPAYILTSAGLQFGERAGTEAAAALAQSLVVFALVCFTALRERAALAFALGVLASACVKLAGFWGALLLRGDAQWAQCAPRWLPGGWAAQLGAPQLALLHSFFVQGLFKHVLGMADKAVLVGYCTKEQQGVYARVENLGSLAPRIVFFPVEEAMRGLVSKLLPQRSPSSSGSSAVVSKGEGAAAKKKGRARSASASASSRSTAISPGSASAALSQGSQLALAASVLASVTHLVLLLGLLIAGLGPAFAPLLVGLLRGNGSAPDSSGSDLSSLLSAYCLYVLAMAVNGVTEAFATAAADPQRLRVASIHLCAITALCTALIHKFIPLYGLPVIIAVSAMGMLLRVASSLSYVHKLLRAEGLEALVYAWAALPSHAATLPVLGACVVLGRAWVAGDFAALLPAGMAGLLLVRLAGAGAIGALALGCVLALERGRLRATWRLLRARE